MMILLQVIPRRIGHFESQGYMLDQDIVKENLSRIALQFLSQCQKHFNRLLVGLDILESA